VHNAEHQSYYAEQSKEDKKDGTCSTHGRDKNSFNILFEKGWREQTTWQTKRRREDNAGIGPSEMNCGDEESFHIAQDSVQCRDLVNTVNEISDFIKAD